MTFLLNNQNVFEYLLDHNLCSLKEQNLHQVEIKLAKNFNLLVSLEDGRKLLAKQERHDRFGKAAGEFLNEWRIQKLLQRFIELSHIRSSLPEVIHFKEEYSIIVFKYLNDYSDLAEFYTQQKNIYPTTIATALGKTIATVHRATLERQEYQDFLNQNQDDPLGDRTFTRTKGLERIGPEIFGSVPSDGLKFFALYQRYDSLGQAIAELASNLKPCCLTHNDLKLNNILLHNDWEKASFELEPSEISMIRLIDWERGAWGDPAVDLGMLIASYLQIWLSSLVVSKSIDVEESLRLAMTPLNLLQPSIAALTKAYFSNFPEILERRPHFLKQVVQFAGFALIQQIQAGIQYQKSFSNTGVCTLQVAKSLLCRPEQSIPTVFGTAEHELICLNHSVA